MSRPAILRFPNAPWSNLHHGITTRRVPPESLPEKRNAVAHCAAIHPTSMRVVTLNQTHTPHVVLVEDGRDVERLGEAGCDGAITARHGLVLTVQTADCTPIFLYDPDNRVVGLLHAGWRGAAAGIVETALEIMSSRFGARSTQLHVGLGPAIGKCCYEVGGEVIEPFATRQPKGQGEWMPKGRKPGKWMLDLHGYYRRRLPALGIDPAHITALEECTACRAEDFYSFRARPHERGRMVSFLGLGD